jgi:hypothetical protein
MWPGEILRGEIAYPSRVCAAVAFQALNRILENPITNRERESKVEVMFRRDALAAAHRATEIVAQSLPDFFTR